MKNTKNKTTLMRVYRSDLEEVKMKFPNVNKADFFHMVVRTNPLIQVEAVLRGTKSNARKQKR